jgi:catechol 2,3-dioxygenase-like lactoylglutathione lyase family enzyme
MIRTTGLVEVVMYVEDLDRMVRFYHDVLGLSVLFPKNITHYKNERCVTLNTGSCLLVLHAGAEKHQRGKNPKMVFAVFDIEQARCFLLQREVEVGDIHVQGRSTLVCDCRDPEGNIFSLEVQEQPVVSNLEYARA